MERQPYALIRYCSFITTVVSKERKTAKLTHTRIHSRTLSSANIDSSNTHTHVHTHTHTHTNTHTHARTHTHTHTRTHARTHARTHTHTHTRTHREGAGRELIGSATVTHTNIKNIILARDMPIILFSVPTFGKIGHRRILFGRVFAALTA